jgi:2',3'-cyclic-nucleotide 2'-phosphodiesterase (5'-nucleotidase family)
MHSTPRRLVGAVAAGACALAPLAVMAGASPADAAGQHHAHQPKPHHHKPHHRSALMPIQLLSFNDFHGNLEPPAGSSGRNVVDHKIDPATGKPVDVTADAGGAAYLATHLAQARKGHRNSLTVAAGDIIGASPLLSAAFHDEPTIESMNKLGLDVTAVGNHEFDEGYKELQRMAGGGCIDDGAAGANNQNSCADHTFKGATFDYLAANVKYAGTDQTILPSYSIKNVHGARIGFIGMTLKDTPSIVTASGVAGLEFSDEVQTANKLVPVLKRKGVNAIVVLIHQGGTPDKQKWTDPASGTTYDVNPDFDYTCGKGGTLAASSPILPIAANLDPAIDMVISGHTHQPYVCSVKDPVGRPRLLTSASSFGRLFTETDLLYDKRTRDIVRGSVKGTNVQVSRDVTPDPAQTSLIDLYKQLVTPIASKVIGHISTDVTATQSPAGESALGDLIADAQLADPSVVTGGQTPVIAFMNPGGIRTDLTAANSKYGEPTGDVTYEEAFNVQPFNNYLVSMSLTGQQIYDLLAQQVTGANAAARKVLQVSQGFSYQLGPAGAVDGSVKLNGSPIDKAASYRIVTNNFLSDGGDGFPAFTSGTSKYFGGLDIDAFSAYLTAHSPYTPGPLTRIQ